MLRLTCILHPALPFSSPSRPPVLLSQKFASFFPKTLIQIPKTPSRFVALAQNSDDGDMVKDPSKKEPEKEDRNGFTNGDAGDSTKDRLPAFNFRWGDLLYPDPDNILAVGLTGLLAWASAQVLWQLFFISFAILVAALKYSFIAALLIFILITLL